MGRKSLAPERRAQILDAFEECILESGLDGASIGAVAEAAGLERTLVHHYFGSRDSLEAALVERLLGVYKAERDAAVSLLPPADRAQRLLDYLFSSEFDPPRFAVLFDELFSAANRNAGTRGLLRQVYEEFEEIAAAEIAKAYPEAPARRRRRVAFAIMCLAESCSSFVGLGFPASRRRSARESAGDLLRTLEPPAA